MIIAHEVDSVKSTLSCCELCASQADNVQTYRIIDLDCTVVEVHLCSACIALQHMLFALHVEIVG